MNRKLLLLVTLVALIIGVSGCSGQAASTGGDHPTFYYFWAEW